MAMLVFLKIAFGIPQNALEVKDTQANGTILPLSDQRNNWSVALPGVQRFSGMNIPGLACTRDGRSAVTEIIKGLSTQLALVLGCLICTICQPGVGKPENSSLQMFRART